MRTTSAIPSRFHTLDALRGIAALSVVLWHWQHFFYQNYALSPDFDKTQQPFYKLFKIAYTQGWLGVDLFFAMSGFIFYWLYSQKISKREISSFDFGILRFSRLYPLHLATLVSVAILQIAYFDGAGSFFVYQFNYAKHFIIQLFLLQSWGSGNETGFNWPSWSISVEFFLYCAFFVLCKWMPVRWWITAIASVLGFVIVYDISEPLGRGVGSFFAGGLIFFIYRKIVENNWVKRSLAVSCFIFAVVGVLAVLGPKEGNLHIPLVKPNLTFLVVALILSPLSILTIALAETTRLSLGSVLAPLGDISFATYLWHFPLQLAFIIVAAKIGLPTTIFYSPWVMIAFFSILIAMSVASYHLLERPMQRSIRKKFESKHQLQRITPA